MFFSIDYRWMRQSGVQRMLEASPSGPRSTVQQRGASSPAPELSLRGFGDICTTASWSSSSVPSWDAGREWGRNNFGRDTGGSLFTSVASRSSSWQPCLPWQSWRATTTFATLGPWLRRWAPLACQREPSRSPGSRRCKPRWRSSWVAPWTSARWLVRSRQETARGFWRTSLRWRCGGQTAGMTAASTTASTAVAVAVPGPPLTTLAPAPVPASTRLGDCRSDGDGWSCRPPWGTCNGSPGHKRSWPPPDDACSS